MSAPVLLLDIDGVCADFPRAILHELEVIGEGSRDESEITQWNILTAVGVTDPATRASVNSRVRTAHFCANLRDYAGAVEGVARLVAAGFDVVPCTSPFPKSPYWHYERGEWVERVLKIPASKVTFTNEKWRIDGDYLVDDKPETLAEWQDHHPLGTAIRFRRPWNEAHARVGEVAAASWPEIVDWLLEVERRRVACG